MKPLNEKQQKVLEFVRERLQDDIPPSVREICDATGIKSTSTVHTYLKLLESEGYIDRRSGLNRAIRLPGESVSRVPLLGKVTAGVRSWLWRRLRIMCLSPAAATTSPVSCSHCGYPAPA